MSLNTYGLDNKIIPFKNRELDKDKPFRVYRNLRARSEDEKYSILQNGLVVGHTEQLMMYACEFIINKRIQQKVRNEKRKKVHAFIKGHISMTGGMGATAVDKNALLAKISYNPYTHDTFIYRDLTDKSHEVKCAACVALRPDGVFAAYPC